MLPSQFCRLRSRVREHLSDLCGQRGNDRGVKQRVKPCQQNTADHHTDDQRAKGNEERVAEALEQQHIIFVHDKRFVEFLKPIIHLCPFPI